MADSVATQLVPKQNRSKLKRLFHQKQITYGTFIPFFVIDSEYLKSALFGNEVLCELEEPASGESSHATFPPELTRQVSTDSGPESGSSETTLNPSINASYTPSFFTECELQVRKLFTFMELHVSKVENDLAAIVSPSPKLASNGNTEELSGENTDEYDQSKLLDSGIEEDQSRYQAGCLQQLKQVLLSLEESINSSFSCLDELVGIHDKNYQTANGRNFLEAKKPKRLEFGDRITTCLTKIDCQLQSYQREENIKIDGFGKLRTESNATAEVRSTPISYFMWLPILLFLATWFVIAYMYYWDLSAHWTIFLRLVRSPLLVVFYIYLWGINMKVWADRRIDYVSIFDYPPNGIPTPRYAFKVAGMLTILFSFVIISLLFILPYTYDIPGKILPLIMWVALIAFILSPLNVYLRTGRFAFLLVFIRILLAPFHTVYFGDFWLADQLNSTVAIFLDLEYLICYLIGGTWTGEVSESVCTSSGNGIRPIITCLPALWRLFQCLRCYYDTRNVKHLINAGKYSTTFPVVILAALFATKVPSTFSVLELDLSDVAWIVFLWMFSSLLHATYTFAWDVYCDWGLMRLSQGTLLRPKLLYPSKCLYFVSMVVDLILRFVWTIKLTLAIAWHLDSDLIYTGLIAAEIFRRFVWNFFRVEYEQVCRMKD